MKRNPTKGQAGNMCKPKYEKSCQTEAEIKSLKTTIHSNKSDIFLFDFLGPITPGSGVDEHNLTSQAIKENAAPQKTTTWWYHHVNGVFEKI